MKHLITMTAGLMITMIVSSHLWAENFSVYRNGVETKDIDRVLDANRLLNDENIRSTLLHQTDRESIHLIQIRFKEPPHIHKNHDLLVILNRGEGVLHIGGETLSMKRGDSVHIPQGITHFFENTGKEVAVGIGIFTPPYDGTDMIRVEP